jgi:phosphatidylserine/phosphatidylglycerophosphate/cardiolipin synthase-like enzyme
VQPIDELETALVDALDRGVKVEIVSARNRDQPAYKSLLNSDLFNKLSKRGAVIYEEPFKFLHMKAISVDDGEQMTLGSFNQDAWSFYCNNEANLFLKRQ